MVTIYRFETYIGNLDYRRLSGRWGTVEGIESIGGIRQDRTAVEVDDSVLGRDCLGLTDIGFNPHQPP